PAPSRATTAGTAAASARARAAACGRSAGRRCSESLRRNRCCSWSDAFPVEFRLGPSTVNLQRALLAHGVGALEDPVLPGGEPAEDPREHRLRSGEAQARLHGGERIGREARALLDGEADLLIPVDLVRRRGDEAKLE